MSSRIFFRLCGHLRQEVELPLGLPKARLIYGSFTIQLRIVEVLGGRFERVAGVFVRNGCFKRALDRIESLVQLVVRDFGQAPSAGEVLGETHDEKRDYEASDTTPQRQCSRGSADLVHRRAAHDQHERRERRGQETD